MHKSLICLLSYSSRKRLTYLLQHIEYILGGKQVETLLSHFVIPHHGVSLPRASLPVRKAGSLCPLEGGVD